MAQPRPAGFLALVAGAGDLELVERQRGLDLGADPRALEPDDQPAAAPGDLLGHGADQPVDQLALAKRGVHRVAPQVLALREVDQPRDQPAGLLGWRARP